MDFISKFIRSKQQPPQILRNEKCHQEVHDHQQQSPLKSHLNASLQGDSNVSAETSETTKENFNPKPLSEIAADKTSKLNPNIFETNITSTPKVVKANFSKDSASDFELDNTLDIEPQYQREHLKEVQNDISFGFLTDGLNKLGLETSANPSNNVTFSDDDEQFVECQSFNDLSNKVSLDTTIVKDSTPQNDSDLNKTISEEADSKNETFTNQDNAEGGNVTFDPNTRNLNETEVLSSAGQVNETFDYIAEAINDKQAEDKFQSFSVTESPRKETAAVEESEPEQQELPMTENPEEATQPIADNISLPPEEPIASEEVSENDPLQEEKSHNDDEIIPQSEDVETFNAEQDFDNERDVTMQEHEQDVPIPMEVSYRNIDEGSRSLSMSMTNSTTHTSPSPVPPVEKVSPQAEEFKLPIDKSENVFFDKMESTFDVQFKTPSVPVFKAPINDFTDDDFKTCGSSFNFAASDFDYLQNFGSTNDDRKSHFQRDSVLLKFDPLLAHAVVVQQQDIKLPPTQEEDDFEEDFKLKLPVKESSNNQSLEEELTNKSSSSHDNSLQKLLPTEDEMSLSVDIMKDIIVENKSSEHIEETKLSAHQNENFGLKMAELENKIKKEADIREEALLKRISEKDKQISKMNGVVEAYEKAISELIAEKEQVVQAYEKKCNDLKADSELNANHLASLESTFSDLHAKYERTKQVAVELKEREENMLQDRKSLTDSLKMQEARYDKMKSHAMSQLEIANNTLAEISRTHQAEATKLKALLKKEEISRASINEQLIQKSKENSELVKICDELINGTQSS